MVVFGAVVSDGRVMPHHFIEASHRTNTNEHLVILKYVLLQWIAKHYIKNRVMFVKDSVPAHKSLRVQKFLKKLPLFVLEQKWPSSSPELNHVPPGRGVRCR